jgi:hypothetical protein
MTKFPIIPAGIRVTEAELLEALIGFLETCAYKEARYYEIFLYLPGKWFIPTAEDLVPTRTRSNECKWKNILRNIWAHIHENPNYDSRIKKKTDGKGGFQLTSYVKKTRGE